jgi:hypothetical protein
MAIRKGIGGKKAAPKKPPVGRGKGGGPREMPMREKGFG